MSGTRPGGKKTAAKVKFLYSDDFYRNIGAIGGKAKVKKGFGVDRRKWWEKLLGRKSRAQIAGKIGGRAPRRRKVA